MRGRGVRSKRTGERPVASALVMAVLPGWALIVLLAGFLRAPGGAAFIASAAGFWLAAVVAWTSVADTLELPDRAARLFARADRLLRVPVVNAVFPLLLLAAGIAFGWFFW